MMNRVLLQGRLTADPELRHTQSGTAVASFRIAVDRNYKDRETGERKADFINVVAWRQTGEMIARYFSKGRMILVDGELQVRDYTDKDGNRRYATEVNANSVYFCDYKKSEGSNAPDTGYTPPQNQFTELEGDSGELPF